MQQFTRLALLAAGLATAGLMARAEPTEPTTDNVPQPQENPPMPIVKIETSHGAITAELFADKAPITVENFLSYAEKETYDNTIFHRVIPDFMIQGGGFTADMVQKPTDDPIKNEARADVPNARGTLAMARTQVVDSATCQFFINLKDNASLNHTAKTPQGYGYAVFGRVIEGMEVVDRIAEVETGTHPTGHRDVPQTPVVIESIRRVPAED